MKLLTLTIAQVGDDNAIEGFQSAGTTLAIPLVPSATPKPDFEGKPEIEESDTPRRMLVMFFSFSSNDKYSLQGCLQSPLLPGKSFRELSARTSARLSYSPPA